MIKIKRKSFLYNFLYVCAGCFDGSKLGLRNTFPTNTCSLILRIMFGVFMFCCLSICGAFIALAMLHPIIIISITIINGHHFNSLCPNNWDLILLIIGMFFWCIAAYILIPPYKIERFVRRHMYFLIKFKRVVCNIICTPVGYRDA